MKNGIALFILAFGCYTAQAQTSGWETGITLSGGRSINLVTGTSAHGDPFAGIIKSNNQSSWSYSAGAYGRKFFKEMYGIEVGLQYTSVGLFKKAQGYFGSQVDPTTGMIGQPVTIKINYRHNYVELPVRFVFKKDVRSKFGIGCFAGVAPALLTHAYIRSVQITEDGRQVSKDGSNTGFSNRFNLFADVGLLLRVNIASQFSLDMRPYFRMTALPTYTKDTSPHFEERFMSAGLAVSSCWKF